MATSDTPAPEGRGRPTDERSLTASERAEYDRLHRAAQTRHRGLRYAATSVLLVLAFLLAPLGVVATWAKSEITDPDRYVETVAPLAREPVVQNVVINRLTRDVIDKLEVERVTNALADALARNDAPRVVVNQARALSGPLENAVSDVVRRVVRQVVTSDEFARTWDFANRRAHAAVVKVLTGEGTSAVQARGDTVVLDIGTVVDKVQQRLVQAGFEKAKYIPDVDRQIVLIKSDKVTKAQTAMMVLDIVGTWLPVTVVVLAALAVWAAPSHRVALMSAGIGIGVMMLLLLVGLNVVRQIYIDSVPPSAQPRAAAAIIFDTLVRFLRNSTLTVLVVAAITAIAAYLYGPGRGARVVRSGAAAATGGTGRALARIGLRTGAAGRWLDTHRPWTTGIAIAAGALALVLWNYPTPASVALVLGIVVAVLALLGILAAAGAPRAVTPAGAAAGTPTAPDEAEATESPKREQPPERGPPP